MTLAARRWRAWPAADARLGRSRLIVMRHSDIGPVMKVLALILVLTASLLTGCFPAVVASAPSAMGRIVSPSGQPSVGVEVRALRERYTRDDHGHTAKTLEPYAVTETNESGEFILPMDASWGIYIAPMDFFSQPAQLEVVEPGRNLKPDRVLHSTLIPCPTTWVYPFGFGKREQVHLGEITVHTE